MTKALESSLLLSVYRFRPGRSSSQSTGSSSEELKRDDHEKRKIFQTASTARMEKEAR
jgi:hypothetical protein